MELDECKSCGHPREDHKGRAMICMKRKDTEPDILCDCYWFDDGQEHILPLRMGEPLSGTQPSGA